MSSTDTAAGSPLWREPEGVESDADVLGIGQCSLDHVLDVEGLPPFGGKERATAYTRLPGGQIATALLACARLGLRSVYLGSVGDDAAADEVLAPLAAAGIDVRGVVPVTGADTQIAVILVDRGTGERTVLWHRDPRLSLDALEIGFERVARARLLLLDAGDPEAAGRAAQIALDAGRPVVLDADTPGPGVDALLRLVAFPVVSREFARDRFGGAESALRALAKLGARLPVVTLGAEGALAWSGGGLMASPAFRVEVRDTTGAGDVFHAGFSAGLLAGLDAPALLRFANAAAGLSCRSLGAQGGLPDRAAIQAFLAEAPAVRG